MSVIGRYVPTFAEASHALPAGMHMNADYPFMLPRIVRIEGTTVTLSNGRKEATITIEARGGAEFGHLDQSSTFERMFNRTPTRFKMQPFKDCESSAIGSPATTPEKASLAVSDVAAPEPERRP